MLQIYPAEAAPAGHQYGRKSEDRCESSVWTTLDRFNPNKRVIEFMTAADRNTPLLDLLGAFATETASEAYAAQHRRCLFGPMGGPGDHGGQPFSAQTRMGRSLGGIQPSGRARHCFANQLELPDADTAAFNAIMEAYGTPKAPKRNKRVMRPFKTPPKTPLKFQCGPSGWRLMR